MGRGRLEPERTIKLCRGRRLYKRGLLHTTESRLLLLLECHSLITLIKRVTSSCSCVFLGVDSCLCFFRLFRFPLFCSLLLLGFSLEFKSDDPLSINGEVACLFFYSAFFDNLRDNLKFFRLQALAQTLIIIHIHFLSKIMILKHIFSHHLERPSKTVFWLYHVTYQGIETDFTNTKVMFMAMKILADSWNRINDNLNGIVWYFNDIFMVLQYPIKILRH